MVTKEENKIEKEIVTGITSSENEAKITLKGIPDKPGIAAKIFSTLASSNINVDMIVQNITDDGKFSSLTFTVPVEDERKSLKTPLDNLLSESNKIAKEIGIKIKSGDNDIGDLKDQSAKLKEDSKKIDKELKLTEESIKSILVNIPNIPIRLRSKIRLLHKKIGTKKFFLELIKLDPISKNFVKPSDTQRVIRAYEVKSFTKRSIYDWFKSTRSDYENDDFFKIYIDFPRAELIKRIEDRTQDMIKNGAVSEVKKFIKLKVPKVKTASKAIGIAEIREYLKKKIEISEVIEKISIKTKQYAKRQSTWGRGNMMDWNKIKSEDLNKFLKKI